MDTERMREYALIYRFEHFSIPFSVISLDLLLSRAEKESQSIDRSIIIRFRFYESVP